MNINTTYFRKLEAQHGLPFILITNIVLETEEKRSRLCRQTMLYAYALGLK